MRGLTHSVISPACALVSLCHTRCLRRFFYVAMLFGCETTGGLGPSAVQLIRVMAQASAELLHMWSYDDIVRELVGSVAIAVQRGGAMAYLEGYGRDGAREVWGEGSGCGEGGGGRDREEGEGG